MGKFNTNTSTAAVLTINASGSQVDTIEPFVDTGIGEVWIDSLSANTLGVASAQIIGDVTSYGDIISVVQLVSSLASGSTDGIHSVTSQHGNISSVVSANARIGSISVPEGDIGTAMYPATIASAKSIGDITAGTVYAAISITGAAADINSLIVTDGDFVGSLSCRKVVGSGISDGYGLHVMEGDLDADITQTAVMNTGFRVGGSFTSGSDISLPSSGLTKQMIFVAGGTGSWSGSAHVKLNGTNLSGEPYYTNTASSVGGGAAGLATFHLHDESCNPTNGNTSVVGRRASFTCLGEDDCCLVFSKATIRMYGPVSLHATLPSVTVKKWNGSSYAAVAWTPTTVHPASGDHREVEVKRVGGVWDLGDYLIEPISGKMLCEDVDGAPDVDAFDYTFSLIDDCEEDSFVQAGYDRNSDNHITAADITAWVAAQCDLTNDGQITVGDLARLMRIVARFN